MGIELSSTYYQLYRRALRAENLGVAYVFGVSLRVIDSCPKSLTPAEAEIAKDKLRSLAAGAHDEREVEAWATVFELYDEAAPR